MKNSPAWLLGIGVCLTLGGCGFRQPEYLTMLTPAQLQQAMSKTDIFLVDVHIPEQKHIRGTDRFVPYNAIEQHLAEFPQDKATPVYLYCEGGPMGNAAARTLHDHGYSKLMNLEGGTNAWRKAGFEFE